MPTRNLYRYWYDPEEGREYYLKIRPDGTALQLSFEKDGHLGNKTIVYDTFRTHPFNMDVFAKHKKVCSKADWQKAIKRVMTQMDR